MEVLNYVTRVTTLLALYSWKIPIKFNHDFQERKLLLIVLLSYRPYHSCPYISQRKFQSKTITLEISQWLRLTVQ